MSAALVPLKATLIGDSVLATVLPWLEQRLDPREYYGEARVGRRMGNALTLIPQLAADGHLAGTVLIQLGTNQPFDATVFDGLMQELVNRGVTRVIFLNIKRPVAWEGVVNQQIAEGVARWPQQAVLIDWNTIGSAPPGWFVSDHVHPNPIGAQGYIDLLQQTLAAP